MIFFFELVELPIQFFCLNIVQFFKFTKIVDQQVMANFFNWTETKLIFAVFKSRFFYDDIGKMDLHIHFF